MAHFEEITVVYTAGIQVLGCPDCIWALGIGSKRRALIQQRARPTVGEGTPARLWAAQAKK